MTIELALLSIGLGTVYLAFGLLYLYGRQGCFIAHLPVPA